MFSTSLSYVSVLHPASANALILSLHLVLNSALTSTITGLPCHSVTLVNHMLSVLCMTKPAKIHFLFIDLKISSTFDICFLFSTCYTQQFSLFLLWASYLSLNIMWGTKFLNCMLGLVGRIDSAPSSSGRIAGCSSWCYYVY